MIIVSVSDWIENQVKDSFLKDIPTKVIKNGIDLDVLKFTESTIQTSINQTTRNNDFINLKSFLTFFNNANNITKHTIDIKPKIIKIGNDLSIGFNINFTNDINQSSLKQINIKII